MAGPFSQSFGLISQPVGKSVGKVAHFVTGTYKKLKLFSNDTARLE
jgi:hypothetical protein